MKNLLYIILSWLLAVSFASAVNFETLVRKNLKLPAYEFPKVDPAGFEEMQCKACEGDLASQKKLVQFVNKYVKDVYYPLERQRGLLFSVRKPVRGYDDSKKNYAVNLEEFFEATCDEVRVKKRNFKVKTADGESLSVGFLKYRSAERAIEVNKGAETSWLPLTKLSDHDRFFVESALADEIFESSSEFEISTDDSRLGEIDSFENKVDTVNRSTGEKLEASLKAATLEGIQRNIILENKGDFPLKNILVEYQSFAEQSIMRLKKDLPTDYRSVGVFEIRFIAPGEKKVLKVDLPETVAAIPGLIETEEYQYYEKIPSDCNQKSEGRINGIWVKVHRITPYGERLTREYKSSGVPSAKWISVAPVNAEL